MKKVILLLFVLFLNFVNAQVSDFKHIDFSKADIIAKYNHGNEIDNLPILAHKLTSKLNTDVEKFRAIYTWVCNNIKVDTKQSDKILSKRKKIKKDSLKYINWNNSYQDKMFKKLFKHKKTMCTGYAYLVKELCYFVNIDCEIIDGYARTASSNIEKLKLANHSWNAVKLNNKWYLADAIWSSGYVEYGKFKNHYNDGYFLTDRVLFSKNHYPMEKKWLLDSTLLNTKFKVTPIVYGGTFKHKVIPIVPYQMHSEVKKNEIISFRFKCLKSVKNKLIALVKFINGKEIKYKIENFEIADNHFSFTSKLKYNGLYDIHLKIEDDIVASYTFKVSN